MIAYIAGPYRSKDKEAVKDNIDRAKHIAVDLWESGIPAICPHLNTANFEDYIEDDEKFSAGYLEILAKCDVLVMCVDEFRGSEGTKREVTRAFELGIPVVPKCLFGIWLNSVSPTSLVSKEAM